MKKCSKCKQDKDLSMFGKCSANKDGLRSDCKECRKSEKKKTDMTEDQLYDECHRLFEYDDMSGKLINKTVNGTSELGAEIAKLDDFYVCKAKRYFEYFTGISASATLSTVACQMSRRLVILNSHHMPTVAINSPWIKVTMY